MVIRRISSVIRRLTSDELFGGPPTNDSLFIWGPSTYNSLFLGVGLTPVAHSNICSIEGQSMILGQGWAPLDDCMGNSMILKPVWTF